MPTAFLPYRAAWRATAQIAIAGCVAALRARAADPFADVPRALQPFVDQGQIAGGVALVATHERVLHVSAVGFSNLATRRPLRPDDVFWIASMSKPITAVAVGILVDDGRLHWDDAVARYLPEFAKLWVVQESTPERRVLVPAARPITLRDLLTHTSGMGEYVLTAPHLTLSQFAASIAHEPLRFQPGARWSYSTAGIDVLGRVVEVASGMPFAEFMQRRIFDPLEMNSTTFWPRPEDEEHRARTYVRSPQSGQLEETSIHYLYHGPITDPQRPALGGAGLFSTAIDLSHFYQAMLGGGSWRGQRVISASTLAEMTRVQTGRLAARPGMPWGLGFCLIADPTQMEANRFLTPGTFGHGGAFGTQSWGDPQRGLVYIFLIQRDKIPSNPDNSLMRQAYQNAVEQALRSHN